MVLLKEFDGSAYRAIPPKAWAKWAPTVVTVFHLGDSKVEFGEEILNDALALAPTEFVGAVRKIMRGERRRNAKAPPQAGASFFVLRQLASCWHSEILKTGIFTELKHRRNSTGEFQAILEVLLEAQYLPARRLALKRLRESKDKQKAKAIAICLFVHRPDGAWDGIWDLITNDDSFGKSFFLDLATRYRFRESLFGGLNADQLAKIYVYLMRAFPKTEEHAPQGAHFVGPRESLAHFRDTIPRQIAGLGTPAAIVAMRWIIDQLPDQGWLSISPDRRRSKSCE
jgi:hypothetical protein